MSFIIILYETMNGIRPVEDFINSIKSSKLKAKTLRNLDLLEEFGNHLSDPYVKQVGNGIWELRTVFSNNITRIFYFYLKNKKIVLLFGFIKKTEKTPRKVINRAIEFKEKYKRRNQA